MNTNHYLSADNDAIDFAAINLLSLSRAIPPVMPTKTNNFIEISQGAGIKNLKRTGPQQSNAADFKRRRIAALTERNASDAHSSFTFILKTSKGNISFSNYLSVSLPTTLERVKEVAKYFDAHVNLSKEGYVVATECSLITTDEELIRKMNACATLTIFWKSP